MTPRRFGAGIVGLREAPSFDRMHANAARARAAGFSSLWIDSVFGWDALSVLAAVGASAPELELGTAIVPIYPRHPGVLAQQAITVDEIVGGRLVLGIGTGHRVVVEKVFGYAFERPGRHMRDYLSILLPLLRDGRADVRGEAVSADLRLELPRSTMPVLVGALGPHLLSLAGSVADGAIVWLANARAMRLHVMPNLLRGMTSEHSRPPRVVCAMPVCVTDDVERARAEAARSFELYGRLPSYRLMLERGGLPTPEDAAIIGGRDDVTAAIDELFEEGATDVLPVFFGTSGERDGTWDLLAELAHRWSPSYAVTSSTSSPAATRPGEVTDA